VVPPVIELPAPPEWLGEIGKQVWLRIAPVLYRIGCFTANDQELFGLYCEAWEEFFEARKEIETCGPTAYTDKGTCYQHPAVGRKNKAIARIRQIGGDFGMSPAARVGLNIQPPKSQNSLAAFKAQ
jgi:P27 family predicted phage terminase small subunit